MTVDQIVQLIQSAVQFGTVIMFGAMGEILTEKSGNLIWVSRASCTWAASPAWLPPSSMSSTTPIPPGWCAW